MEVYLRVIMDEELTEYGGSGISDGLVKCGITYESFVISEGNVGWSCSVALIVWYDFCTVIPPNSHARVGCSQVDPYCMSLFFFSCRHWHPQCFYRLKT